MNQDKVAKATKTTSPATTQIPNIKTSYKEPAVYIDPVTPMNYHPLPNVRMLYLGSGNFCYNATESATLIARGDFGGLESIYYKGRKLDQNVDYRKELHYLVFTENFLMTIPEGENELDVIGYRENSHDMRKETIKITKYNYKLDNTYERKYPASETSNFYTTMDCNRSGGIAYFWVKDISKVDQVFVDGVELKAGEREDILYNKPIIE